MDIKGFTWYHRGSHTCWLNLRAQMKGQPLPDQTTEQVSARPRGLGCFTVARNMGLGTVSFREQGTEAKLPPTLFINTQEKKNLFPFVHCFKCDNCMLPINKVSLPLTGTYRYKRFTYTMLYL